MQRVGMLIALCAAISWGYVYATTQEVVERLPPIATLAMIYWLGAVVLLPVGIWYGPEIARDVVAHPSSVASTIISIIVAEFLIIWSISLLGGVEAGLVEITYPVWTMMFLWLLKDQKPSPETLVGALLVGAGLLVIARK